MEIRTPILLEKQMNYHARMMKSKVYAEDRAGQFLAKERYR